MMQQLCSNLLKSSTFCLYNKPLIRRKRTICDPGEKQVRKKTDKIDSCFSQVKALHDRDTHPVSHVIIDLDGVILDSNDLNTLAHEEYLMKWKKALKRDTKYRILGMRNIDAGRLVTDEYAMPFDGEVYAHGVWQYQRSLYHHAKLVRGIDDMVCYFLKQQMPLAMVSSSHKKAFEILFKRLKGFEKYFCHVINGDEVVNGKPNPEVLIKAARMFHDGPKEISKYLVIDGSYSGALAAKAAGMQVILVSDENMPKTMQNAANVVLNDIRNFDPTEFHLPEMKKVPRK